MYTSDYYSPSLQNRSRTLPVQIETLPREGNDYLMWVVWAVVGAMLLFVGYVGATIYLSMSEFI
jgi:hypothetical protein